MEENKKPNTKNKPPKRKKDNRPNGAPPRGSNTPSVNPLKSKIRDLTRVLDHADNLPAGVRIEKERALKGYQQDLESAEREKQKQALIKRYHMVRFFERQKAGRHVKKAQKRLDTLTPGSIEHEEALGELHMAEVDLNYTLYSPLTEKYQGIYPKDAQAQDGVENGEQGKTEAYSLSRPAMWNIVERCMSEGTLDALRDGKLTTAPSKDFAAMNLHGSKHGKSSSSQASAGKLTEMEASAEQGNESDGGFFEE